MTVEDVEWAIDLMLAFGWMLLPAATLIKYWP